MTLWRNDGILYKVSMQFVFTFDLEKILLSRVLLYCDTATSEDRIVTRNQIARITIKD